jgi:hypothetical protein
VADQTTRIEIGRAMALGHFPASSRQGMAMATALPEALTFFMRRVVFTLPISALASSADAL